MTNEEAATLLGVPPDATPADVQRRYEDLHNEFQVRLSNAPTPALKKTYQKNLQDIRDACELLAPGIALGPATSDLPTAEPTVTTGTPTSRPVRTSAGPGGREGATASAVAEAGLSRSTMTAIAAAVIFAAAASLFLLLWRGTVGARADTEKRLGTVEETLRSAQAELKEYQQLFQSGPLDVCNRSAKPVRIETVVAIYREQNGRTRTVHSGSFGYPMWEIQPGNRTRLTILRGQQDDWEGAAAAYALQLIYANSEPFLIAGLMADAKDGCVNLFLD